MQQTKQMDYVRFAMSFIRWVGLTLFTLFIWHTILDNIIFYTQEKNKELYELITKKKLEIDLFSERQKNLLEFTSRLQFIASLNQRNNEAAQLLDELSKATPNFVIIDQLKRQGKEIFLAGSTHSDVELIQFLGNIDQSVLFTQPLITNLNTINQRRYFQLTTWIKT